MVKTNSIKAWMLASRPKTLTGAAAPVILGGTMAGLYMHQLHVVPFVLALVFALLMQVAANFINDYFDWKKGSDRNEDRLGPERACAQGWITPNAMLWGITVVIAVACCVGLPLAVMSGWWLVGIGAVCVFFAFVYTLWFSYLGLGDVLVLLFFGIVPVGFTFYVMTDGQWPMEVTLLGVAQGLVTDLLLLVNNYRDRDQDEVSGKKTLVVRFGASFGRISYLVIGYVGVIIAALGVDGLLFSDVKHSFIVTFIGCFLWIMLHMKTYGQLKRLEGKLLNKVLGATARNIFLFAIAFALMAIVTSCCG